MEAVSGTEAGNRHEIIVTGIDYEPETLVIAQMFPEIINISNTVVREFYENGHRYITCRIGFEWKENERGGDETAIHPEHVFGRYWAPDDLLAWTVGEHTYLFRCIDDDYKNNSDNRSNALFLCETVIRSDIDSTDSKREILTFGRTNNYKTSDIRKWLQENLADEEDCLITVDTGVNSAYLGATVPGTYEAFSTNGLLRHELYPQILQDELFLLSLEEAIRYRDVLWDTEDNRSPYSHGYWLRTPAYAEGETGSFCYGEWAYAVDLEKGCIRPMEVTDGSVGIRPAFCLPQG